MTIETTRQGRFEWERALRDQPGVSLPLRGLLLTLATYSSSPTGGDIFPSIQRLAKTMDVSRSTLTTHLQRAQELGWLVKLQGNAKAGRPSHYALSVPTGASSSDTRAASGGQGQTVEEAPMSGEQDTTKSVITQGPLQKVPNESANVDPWAEVERLAEEREAQIQADMLNAPSFY